MANNWYFKKCCAIYDYAKQLLFENNIKVNEIISLYWLAQLAQLAVGEDL